MRVLRSDLVQEGRGVTQTTTTTRNESVGAATAGATSTEDELRATIDRLRNQLADCENRLKNVNKCLQQGDLWVPPTNPGSKVPAPEERAPDTLPHTAPPLPR
jgi:hypothetical protein